jgi:hypothetical protein
MISEVVNALFITYFATEYLVADTKPRKRRPAAQAGSDDEPNDRDWSLYIKILVVALINVTERYYITISTALYAAADRFFHLPKILFVVVAYVGTLYVDCRRSLPTLAVPQFLRKVLVAFGRILPLYPLLAVAVSFIFLPIVSAFEALHLPLEYLNMPIYYGTLYGPFSYVYYLVKQRIVQDSLYTLPSSQSRFIS